MSDKTLIHFRREKEEPQGITMARLDFNPHDCWLGVYWKRVSCERCQKKHLNLWLTLVPMFPVHIVFGGRTRTVERH